MAMPCKKSACMPQNLNILCYTIWHQGEKEGENVSKGVICAFIEPGYENSAWFTRSFAGLKAGAAKRDVTVQCLRGVSELSHTDAGSVILLGTTADWMRYMLSALRKRNIHGVLLGASPQDFDGDVSGSMVDRQLLVERMVEYFRHCGRTRLACLGNKPQDINDEMRKLAFLNAMEKRGLSARESDVYGGSDIRAAIDRLLERADMYDGVVCVNDPTAVLLLESAVRKGIRVPEDLFVAGSGDYLLGRLCTPTLTTSTLDYYQMGLQSANVWQYLERNPEVHGVRVHIPCRIICRGSTDFLPVPDAAGDMHMEIASERHSDEALRKLDCIENCLLRCDALDMRILRGILSGDSMEKIAEELFVAQSTVSYHMHKLYQALGVDSRRALLAEIAPHVSNLEFFDRNNKI